MMSQKSTEAKTMPRQGIVPPLPPCPSLGRFFDDLDICCTCYRNIERCHKNARTKNHARVTDEVIAHMIYIRLPHLTVSAPIARGVFLGGWGVFRQAWSQIPQSVTTKCIWSSCIYLGQHQPIVKPPSPDPTNPQSDCNAETAGCKGHTKGINACISISLCADKLCELCTSSNGCLRMKFIRADSEHENVEPNTTRTFDLPHKPCNPTILEANGIGTNSEG